MTAIYRRILEQKKESGLLWNQIADKAGIHLASWMTGVDFDQPTDADLRAIAPILKTTFAYLKYGK